MSTQRLSDAQLTALLRGVVPPEAPAGLRSRIVAEASATRQRTPRWSPLPALVDIDPAGRRRALLLAAALLAALALVGTAVVGSYLIRATQNPLLEQTRVADATPGPSQGLTLDPPADVGALVGSAYSRMPVLPPMTINAVSGTETIRIYVDESGAVRIERATAGSADPESYEILSGTRMGTLVTGPDGPAWYEQSEAISEDPRVFVYAALSQAGVTMDNSDACDSVTTPDAQPSSAPRTGWAYVGAERVAGRAAYQVECRGRHLWLDAETRITLRSSGPVVDEEWNVVPGQTETIEVTSIDLGQPPADLFAIRPPAGIPVLDDEAYSCLTDPTCLASPRPIETPPPAAQAPEPARLKALIAAAQRADLDLPAFRATMEVTSTKYPGSRTRVFAAGTGRYRIEDTYNVGRGDEGWAVTIGGTDRVLRSEGQGESPAVWTVTTRERPTAWPLRLLEACRFRLGARRRRHGPRSPGGSPALRKRPQ